MMHNHHIFIFFILVVCKQSKGEHVMVVQGLNVTGVQAEETLRHKLFSTYDRTVRPSNDSKTPVVVNVALSLTQLLDVDEKRQVVTLSTWLYQIWQDYRLEWDPDDHSAIKSLAAPASELWYPDTALYTSASEEHDNFPKVITDTTTTLIRFDGNVTACSAHIYIIPCKMDIVNFPFDRQSCDMTIGTWVYNVTQLDYKPMFDTIQYEGFIRNTEWSLTGSAVARHTADFIVFSGTYAYMSFTVFMERKPLYYIVNLILPCALFSLLSVAVFLLPPNSNDRINMGVSILLTLFVFNLLVADIMPPTSENVPALSLYLLFNMASIVGVVVISAFLISLYGRRGKIPHCAERVFLDMLAKVVCLDKKVNASRAGRGKVLPSTFNGISRSAILVAPFEPESPENENEAIETRAQFRCKCGEGPEKLKAMEKALMMQNARFLRDVVRKLEEVVDLQRQLNFNEGAEEWQTLALVINRIVFILFLIMYISGTVFIFLM